MSKQPLIENLEHIDGTKEKLRGVLESKGIDVSDEDTFRSYADKFDKLSSDSTLEEFKEVEPKTVAQTVLPSEGFKAIKQVAVKAVTSDIDEDLKPENIKKDVDILGVLGTYEVKLQKELEVTPSTEQQFIAPEDGFDGIKQVNVKPVTAEIDEDIQSKNIKKGVNILGVEGELESSVLQYNKDIRPSTEMQFLTPDDGADGVRNMTVYPVTRLIDEDIQPENIKKGITILGVEGTVEQYILEEYKVVSPTTYHQTILPSEGNDGFKRIELNAADSSIDPNIKPENIKEGAVILGVRGIYDGVEDLDLQTKSVNPTSEDEGVVVTYDSNYDALAKVIVNPIRASMVKGLTPDIIKKGEKVLEMTGTYGEKSQVKAVYPTTEQQYVYPDTGIKFLEHVIVQPVDRSIDNDIQPKNIKLGVNILGVDGEYTGDFVYQNKTASLNTEKPITYTADKGYDALESVTVPRVTSAIDSDIRPENIRKGIEILEVVGTYEPAPSMEKKYITPRVYQQTIYPDSGYASMDRVEVGAVTSSIDSNIKSGNIRSGVRILGVEGTVEAMNPEQVNVSPSIERQEFTPSEGYNCINKVVAYPVTSEIDGNIISTNIKEGITILGVEGAYKGETVELQNKTITPLDAAQEITADEGYDALSTVIVNPPNQYDIEVNPSIEEYKVNKESNRYIKSVTVNPVDSSIDPNIQPENIRKNMSILGVVGNYEGENLDEPIATSIVKGSTRDYYELSYDTSISYTHNVPGIIHTLLKIPGNLAISGTSLDYAFESMDALIEAPNIDTTEVTSMIDTFNGCSNLSKVPIYSTSKVTSFSRCFAACRKITSVPDWDYSNATSTYLMFADCGITAIPTENFMQRFPKITDMSYMFCGCPLSGDLDITLGRPSDYEANKYLAISQFANEVFDNTHITLDGPCSASGKTAWSYMSRDAIPTGSISTIVDYNEFGYFKYFNSIALPTNADTVLRINSNHPERKIDLNLVGTTESTNIGYYSFDRTAPKSDIYINLPDTGGVSQLCYYCGYLTNIHLYIGPSCKSLNSIFYNCSRLVSVFPYEDGAEVIIDGSMINNVKSAFYGCKALVDFVGVKDLGKNYTQKTTNYANYKFDLSSCTSLSVESLRSIIDNLYDLNLSYASIGTLYRQQLVLGSTNLAKLTAEEVAVATNKGWNVS